MLEYSGAYLFLINIGSIAALEVFNKIPTALLNNFGMMSRNGEIIDNNIVVLISAYRDWRFANQNLFKRDIFQF